jgi:hypothetical protein
MWAQLDQLARPVYAGLRAGHVAPEAAFDLAVFVMGRGHSDPVLTGLAELAVGGQHEQRLAELAARVLAVSGWEPGFADEPDWLEVITQRIPLSTAAWPYGGVPDRGATSSPLSVHGSDDLIVHVPGLTAPGRRR